MTVADHIVTGLTNRELPSGVKGASRAAIKSWLLSKGHLVDGPTTNNSIKKAINKLMEQNMLIAVTNHRFKINVTEQAAKQKAAKDIIMKKKAAKAAKVKAATAAKKAKVAAKKKAAATKKKAAAAKKMAAKKKKTAAKKKTKKAKKTVKKVKQTTNNKTSNMSKKKAAKK